MIELKRDQLVITCPDVHPEARLTIGFQRTLRIPDEDRDYPLPPSLGQFPLRHVDDFSARLPATWAQHGGVMLPMAQSEAMWLNFDGDYPFALKIATGKVNAVTGEEWVDGIHRDPQDYMVTPDQPWLDGYCIERGTIRQFVAMPLGRGYTAEEQITGKADHGGLQIVAYPMKAAAYREWSEAQSEADGALMSAAFGDSMAMCLGAAPDMGLAPGGRMQQEIYDDPHNFDVWDTRARSRCFVHIANSQLWADITGEQPPTTPPTALEYTNAGLPWFDYYGGDAKALEGAKKLAGLKTVSALGDAKGEHPLPENHSVSGMVTVPLGVERDGDRVREGRF
jgi:hypothetical protein